MVSMRDVAAHAGVSHGTVSHYLNHPDRVSQDKAERIRGAIETLGFVPSIVGRQLRLGQSSTIAYIVPDVSNPFFASIAEGVEQRAAANDLSVFIANTMRDRRREDAYLELFEQHRVRGMLVSSPELIEDRLLRLGHRGTPTVLVGQAAVSSDQLSVSIDDIAGGALATRHLIGLGRRRIAFVGGPLGVRQIHDRLQGASETVREVAGVSLEVLDMTDRTVAGGRAVGAAILRRAPEQRPDAVLAANDLMALGILHALVNAGVDVPRSIAIVGYDDIEFAASSVIPLTTVRAPHEEFGFASVDLLLAGAASAGAPRHLVFTPELVVRATAPHPD